MKKIGFVFMLAFLFVSCGEESKTDNGSSSESTISCSEGTYECKTKRDGTETSRYCEDGSHYKTEECYDGCNESTGRCYGSNDYGACTTQGAFRCSGDMLQKCDQEEWKNFAQCSADKPCNAEKGACVTGGSTEPTNPDNGAAEACTEIYQCFSQCEDNDCANACVNNGDPDGQEVFMTMYNCWADNCASATDFTSCAKENCLNETEACGLSFGKDGDTNYGSPYGNAQITLSSSYVLGEGESPAQNTVTMGSFISGTIGNSQIGNAAAAQSYYYTALSTQNGTTYLQTLQLFTDAQGNPLSPIIVVVTNADAAVGNAEYSLVSQTAVGQIFMGDATVDAQGYLNIPCYDAFAEGTLSIQGIQATQGGNFTLSGTIDLYSPANYMGYGDIQQDLGASACSPK